MNSTFSNYDRRLPHALAVALVCATFPLLWVGGLVTTYDAGMAVPDWPTTYGYNIFLFPWRSWLGGPWGLFIEHAHRLLGALVGIMTIALAVVLWRRETRSWIRRLGLLALLCVVAQGVLGGMRVVLDSRLLAQVHGSFGPMFLSLVVFLAVATSRYWQRADNGCPHVFTAAPTAATAALAICAIQVFLGAAVRHLPPTAEPSQFRMLVIFHVFVGVLLGAQALLTAWRIRTGMVCDQRLSRPAMALVLLVLAQIALGLMAWLANYGWPAGWQGHAWAAQYTITARGAAQSVVTTAHQAGGSLILAVCTLLTARLWRAYGAAGAAPLTTTDACIANGEGPTIGRPEIQALRQAAESRYPTYTSISPPPP